MNVYDSDRMLATLVRSGFRAEPDPRKADVILINTCSIREKAEQKVLSLLGELKELKQQDPRKVIGVAGCIGQRMGRTLLQRVPHLDLVIGPDSIGRVAELLDTVVVHGRRLVDTDFDNNGQQYSQPHLSVRAKPSEYLTIVKGCDHFCTYCIVPFVRGREKSRPLPEILRDTKNLIARGTQEIIFLGQNINTYGKGTPYTLSHLIDWANRVEGLMRIRYLTSHPKDLREDLISQFGTVAKLCPQLHLPFQAGSDRILKRMGRLHTRAEYLMKVEMLRKTRPDIALSTDVIVGFPGESDKDFEETLHVLRQLRFSGAYLFKYSERPGTRAESFSDQVPESVKEERLKQAQDVAHSMIQQDNIAWLGKIAPVLIESLDKKSRYYTGRSPHNKVVHVLNAGEACVGKIIDVKITQANGSNLKGFYVGAPEQDRVLEPRCADKA